MIIARTQSGARQTGKAKTKARAVLCLAYPCVTPAVATAVLATVPLLLLRCSKKNSPMHSTSECPRRLACIFFSSLPICASLVALDPLGALAASRRVVLLLLNPLDVSLTAVCQVPPSQCFGIWTVPSGGHPHKHAPFPSLSLGLGAENAEDGGSCRSPPPPCDSLASVVFSFA